ncbi:MAG: riboflavin synthase [Muribaculaceae bacterium]|nr:riboflavin synthase [Muribaculaceae bacterium]
MFSGIVEATAKVVAIEREGTNLRFTFTAPFASELTIDQSVAHNGVCLTVVSLDGDRYSVVAIEETLRRSNLGLLKVGDKVNIERSMRLDGRLDGHIVQGHVDTTAVCESVVEADGSHVFRFRYDIPAEMARKGYVTVEKGSVTVNGVSLTVCDSERDSFSVAIIPYTFDNTNFHDIREGSTVNIEFDIIGKYLSRMMEFVK